MLLNGEKVAVKIQRPGLKQLFDIDLSKLISASEVGIHVSARVYLEHLYGAKFKEYYPMKILLSFFGNVILAYWH